MTQIVRTHDAFYLEENRYKNPKQLFAEIIDAMRKTITADHGVVISDVGCAAGEFPYALRAAFPHATIRGYDLLESLIAKAKKEVPSVDFFVGSITDPAMSEEAGSDYTLCTGVLSIFDEFEPIIENLLRWTRPGGTVFLHGLFNPFPIDVNIKYNLSEDYGKGIREAGWNLFSIETVTRWLKARRDVESFEFSELKMKIDLERQKDPVRSWTIKDEEGRRHITNGLRLLQPHGILRIKKK